MTKPYHPRDRLFISAHHRVSEYSKEVEAPHFPRVVYYSVRFIYKDSERDTKWHTN